MALNPTSTNYWVELLDDNSVQWSSLGNALIGAFNKRDAGAVEHILSKRPEDLNVKMIWAADIDERDYEVLSAAEAAVRMSWGAVLPVLHQAGERFEESEQGGALSLATLTRNATMVRKILALGANPNGYPGHPPLASIRQRTIDPQKEHVAGRICQAYIKAGVDVWAQVLHPVATSLPEHLMTHLALTPCRDLLKFAVASGQALPISLQNSPSGFWKSMARCIDSILDDDDWSALPQNAPVLADISTSASQLGLTLFPSDVLNMTRHVADNLVRFKNSTPRNAEIVTAWLSLCDTFMTISQDPNRIQTVVAQGLSGCGDACSGVVSDWIKKHLSKAQPIVDAPFRTRPRF